MAPTHEVTVSGATLTKRYTSWGRGEHVREWAVLQHLERHAPGLAPRPLAADLRSSPPAITMSVVPGVPLTGRPGTEQIAGLAAAIKRLWDVPPGDLAELCPRVDDLNFARMLTAGTRPDSGITATAFDAAVSWWSGPDPDLLRSPPGTTVIGHRDPHLANYLWDGRRVRIVDVEDAATSDPATELAILVEHLSARDLDADAFCRLFDDVDQRRLLASRRVWAMFWLYRLMPGGPSARRNPPGAADLQARRLLSLLDEAGG
jgi:aminoglycoside phosphotransferase (APT) family kinase protein